MGTISPLGQQVERHLRLVQEDDYKYQEASGVRCEQCGAYTGTTYRMLDPDRFVPFCSNECQWTFDAGHPQEEE